MAPAGPEGPLKEGPRGPRERPANAGTTWQDMRGPYTSNRLQKRMGLSWRDFLEWFKPTFIVEREKLVHEVLDDNDALRKDVARLKKRNWRLEAALERVQEQARAREEVQCQQIRALCDQARRCKCRS